MQKEIIRVPVLSDSVEKRNVSLSLVVKAGDFLFVSGVPPLNVQTGAIERGDIRQQTELCLEVLKRCLEAAGSTLDKVVKTTILLTNAAYSDDVNEIYGKYFPHNPPARTFCTVGSWPMKFDIEIDCIAIA